jgi:hypothetical protein
MTVFDVGLERLVALCRLIAHELHEVAQSVGHHAGKRRVGWDAVCAAEAGGAASLLRDAPVAVGIARRVQRGESVYRVRHVPHARAGCAASKSMRPTALPFRTTQLYGAASPWQTTSAGWLAGSHHRSSGPISNAALAS